MSGETAFVLFLILGMIGLGLRNLLSAASKNETAKKVGLGLLERWLRK